MSDGCIPPEIGEMDYYGFTDTTVQPTQLGDGCT